jgi:hypothetical protein
MDKKTINAMLKVAKTNGVAEIVYTTGMSSSATLSVYLTRYPNAEDGDAQKFAEVLADYDKKLKPSDFLDTVSVKDGFIVVTINHLYFQLSSSCYKPNDIVGYYTDRTGSKYDRHYQRGYVDTLKTVVGEERLYSVAIPFENIVAIKF